MTGALLPPMTIGEMLAYSAWVVAVQLILVRLGLGELMWPALVVANALVWFVFIPRRSEVARRRTAIATGAAVTLWIP